jgi:WD40 repeat protein
LNDKLAVRVYQNFHVLLFILFCLVCSCTTNNEYSSSSLIVDPTHTVFISQEGQQTSTADVIDTTVSPTSQTIEDPVITSENASSLSEKSNWEREGFTDFAWSFDSVIIALFNPYDGGISLYKFPSLELKWSSEKWVRDVMFINDHKVLIAADVDDECISFIDIIDGHISSQIVDKECGSFTPDGLLIDDSTGTLFGGVGLAILGPDLTRIYHWDIQHAQCLGLFVEHRGELNSLSLSPDGAILLVGLFDTGDPYVAQTYLYDVASREPKCWFKAEDATISPRGDIVAVVDHESESLKFYDPDTCSMITELPSFFPRPITSYELAFSPNGDLLAIGYDSVRIFDTSSGELIVELGSIDRILAIGFSPNGRYLLISECTPCKVSLWAAMPIE